VFEGGYSVLGAVTKRAKAIISPFLENIQFFLSQKISSRTITKRHAAILRLFMEKLNLFCLSQKMSSKIVIKRSMVILRPFLGSSQPLISTGRNKAFEKSQSF
jgi:hypothetical protein